MVGLLWCFRITSHFPGYLIDRDLIPVSVLTYKSLSRVPAWRRGERDHPRLFLFLSVGQIPEVVPLLRIMTFSLWCAIVVSLAPIFLNIYMKWLGEIVKRFGV